MFSFLDILTSSKTSGSWTFLDFCLLSSALLLFFPSVSFSPSLCSDERQALSRQWHSKTSGLGSSVSGYSTLLGAISLSKVRPAHSPTENPQISYYSLHTEGRYSCFTSVCMCAKKKNRGEQTHEICIRGCQRTACGERESGVLQLHALQIYEWVSCSLGCIFLKFPRGEAKCKARHPNPAHHELPLNKSRQPLILHQVCCRRHPSTAL